MTIPPDTSGKERSGGLCNLDAKIKNKLSKNTKEIAIPKLNFVISSYYKGTGLEEVLKKLEKYLDTADVNESDITNI